MPVFHLDNKLVFPPVELTDPVGIIAFGGDLSEERLLLAYRSGIFPWYSQGEPITWWSPNERYVLYPNDFNIPKSLRKPLREHQFNITFDHDFPGVIEQCKSIARRGQEGTWITDEMMHAYVNLHESGYAHSVEAWDNKKLVGGLYGVSLGGCFFGESMFSKSTNASKLAFTTLVKKLISKEFGMIDCQVYTKLLSQFGAQQVDRNEYMVELKNNLEIETLRGSWSDLFEESP